MFIQYFTHNFRTNRVNSRVKSVFMSEFESKVGICRTERLVSLKRFQGSRPSFSFALDGKKEIRSAEDEDEVNTRQARLEDEDG